MPASALLDAALAVAEWGRPDSLSDDELVAEVRAIGELRRLTDALGACVAGELERRCEPGGADAPDRRRGHVGAPSLIAHEGGIDRTEASAWRSVGTATAPRTAISGEPLPPVRPVLSEAVDAGRVSIAAADRTVRALAQAGERATPSQMETFERTLVEVAPHVTSRELRGVCRRMIDVVDPDGAQPREDELRRRSSVTVHQQDDGLTRIVAKLHPEAAAFVIAALDARTATRRQPRFEDGFAIALDDEGDGVLWPPGGSTRSSASPATPSPTTTGRSPAPRSPSW